MGTVSRALAATSFALISSQVSATDLNLSLNVTGTILEAPSWRDSGSSKLNSVSFNFDNIITGSASVNVDSAALSVVLSDPSNAGSVLTVDLTTPADCAIGGHPITDSHVFLILSNSELANSTTFTVSEGASNSLKLRFADEGSYGDKSGAVLCSTPGNLTYTY